MQYRPEIDGLRTVAVVPVILFHAGFKIFSGGFVGVDIFFVISGYLITSIIISDLEQGKFSLLSFYERRARRILPALFFVLIVCVPFAWMWLLPGDFRDFSQSLVAVATFSSNILFWQETGYFATASELKPLLHTWSLAVEEQYYIFFPLFMMFFWRLGLRWVLLLLGMVFLISLGLGHWGSLNKPDAAFFLLPTRAWELLIGAFAAIYLRHMAEFNGQLGIRTCQALSILGFLLVFYAIFFFDKSVSFPGFSALVPTIGAGLIILFATKGTWVNWLLSTKGFVGIGLISYSAYLWHQPLMAFARHRSVTEPSEWLMGFLCIVTIIMAYMSWRFVERPFRNKQIVNQKYVLYGSSVALTATVIIGLTGHFLDGFPNRVPAEVELYLAAKEDKNPLREACLLGSGTWTDHKQLPFEECTIGPKDNNVDTVIIGDSHADSLAFPIMQSLSGQGISSTLITIHACQPFAGFDRSFRNCHKQNSIIENYIRNSSIETIIIAARWTALVHENRFDNGEGGVEPGSFGHIKYFPDFVDLDAATTRLDKASALWRSGINRYLDMGKNVVVVYPIPEAGWNVPDIFVKSSMFDQAIDNLSTSFEAYKKRNDPIVEVLKGIQHPNLLHVPVSQIFCDSFIENRCANAVDGELFYVDDDHLSLKGAALVAPDIVEAVLNLKD